MKSGTAKCEFVYADSVFPPYFYFRFPVRASRASFIAFLESIVPDRISRPLRSRLTLNDALQASGLGETGSSLTAKR